MKVLVVDDEPGLRHTLSQILAGDGHTVAVATDGAAALAALAADGADIVLCDVRMPVMDGLTFLERYQQADGKALVIMMSAYGDDDAAISAMQRGAYDFISKPFRADQVQLVVRKAMEREGLRRNVERLATEVEELRGGGEIAGRSPALRDAIALAKRVARHPSTVLITGESGTGKEVMARLIHRSSPRHAAPFIAVNCGAIPEALLESELFGHARGAFTGATAERTGLFEEATGGTLFLDEIGELPVLLQVKLLRALQEGEVRRVGDNASRPVDVRIIAATARELEAEVAEGRFRADLFYRLNVVRLQLPPLRERGDDVIELAKHFIGRYNERLGLAVQGLSPQATRALMLHSWPGNVRELENAIERAMVMTDGPLIEPAHLPAASGPPSNGTNHSLDLSIKRQTEALERALIAQALERTAGNRTRAAQLLELSHRALLYKIREYGLDQ